MYVCMCCWKHSVVARDSPRLLFVICLTVNLDKLYQVTIYKSYKKCLFFFFLSFKDCEKSLPHIGVRGRKDVLILPS